MKKKLLFIFLTFSLSTAFGQLEKGSQLAGAQINLMISDMYSTHIEFSVSPNQKTYGFNLVPMYGFAVQRNWVLGLQATVGFESAKYTGGIFGPDQTITNTDLGIAPFTRYYLDITKNKKWKIFGLAALEINTERYKTTYAASSSATHSSYSYTKAALGGGVAYFGRKISIDLNMSNTALRLGVYRIFTGRKK